METIFSKFTNQTNKEGASSDLEEMVTALAFELPVDGRSEPGGMTTESLISTVVVLDVAQNCFNFEGDIVGRGRDK